jgi:hypothetical protein
MLIVNAVYQNQKTFALMPTSNDCPFLEMIYDPGNNVMQVISKHTHEVFMLVDKLDSLGKQMTTTVRDGKHRIEQPVKERRIVNENYHYTIYTQEEIEHIVDTHAINAATSDYRKFFSKVEQVAA